MLTINYTSPVFVTDVGAKYYQFIGTLSNGKQIRVTYRFRKLTGRWEYDISFGYSRIYYSSYEMTETQAIKSAMATVDEMRDLFKE